MGQRSELEAGGKLEDHVRDDVGEPARPSEMLHFALDKPVAFV